MIVIPGHGTIFTDVAGALKVARRRLEGLQRDPTKHARHAIKVLIKFKLLEKQRMSRSDWMAWVRETPYLAMVCARFFQGVALDVLAQEILGELVAAKAAELTEYEVRNL